MEENAVNPYQSPLAGLMDGGMADVGQTAARPAYKLFSIWSIILATIFGAPVAGGIVMAINYKRLGFPGKATHAVVWSAVATAVILAIAVFMPEDIHIPNMAFVIPQLVVMYLLAKTLQGPAMETHQAQGGPCASAWLAAGIGLLSMIAIFFVLGVAAFVIGE